MRNVKLEIQFSNAQLGHPIGDAMFSSYMHDNFVVLPVLIMYKGTDFFPLCIEFRPRYRKSPPKPDPMPPGSYMSPLSPDNAIFSPSSGLPQLTTSRSIKAQLHEVKIVQVSLFYGDVKLCGNSVWLFNKVKFERHGIVCR
jgi:hypothetical protein